MDAFGRRVATDDRPAGRRCSDLAVIPHLPALPTSLSNPSGVALIRLLAGALASWALLWILIPWLRRRLLDRPNARSSHRQPTPRGGGLAFVVVGSGLGGLGGDGSWASWIPLLCCPLAMVGLLDDRLDLPAGLRYGAQLLTAGVLLAIAALPLPWWLWPLGLIAITAVINFVNFMDGLDGLVASCCVVLLSLTALGTSASLWGEVGALIGFLIWNWSPARVFMGDVGSTWLGAVLAGLVLQQPTPGGALGLLLVAVPLLADACLCVLRRWRAGQPIFQAHRLHLFQRLHQAGWSHRQVAGLYGGSTVVLAGALVLGGLPWVLPLAAVTLGAGLWLDRCRSAPFA